jgi:hypothetical protein
MKFMPSHYTSLKTRTDNNILNSSSPLYSTVCGTMTAFVSGSVVVFSLLPRWGGISQLSFSKKSLDPQNKYLIAVNNNNKQIRPKPYSDMHMNLYPRPPRSDQTATQPKKNTHKVATWSRLFTPQLENDQTRNIARQPKS